MTHQPFLLSVEPSVQVKQSVKLDPLHVLQLGWQPENVINVLPENVINVLPEMFMMKLNDTIT